MFPQQTGFTKSSDGRKVLSKSLTVAFLLGVIVTALPRNSAAEKPADETLARVFAAARARESRVRSLTIAWRAETVRYADANRGRRSEFEHPEDESFEKGDVTHNDQYTLRLDGDKLRDTFRRDDGSPSVNTFDGKLCRRLSYAFEKLRYPQGTLSHGADNTKMLTFKPVVWTFRLLSPTLSTFKQERFRVVDESADLDGTRCVHLSDDVCDEDGRPVAAGSTSLWLDPARDYCVRKYAYGERRPGRADTEVDITHIEHPIAGWIPSTWSILSRLDGKVSYREISTVTSVEVNPAIAAGEFQLDFPSGTMVIDRTGKEERVFIVQPDGTERTVTQKEQRAKISYDDLLKSEPDTLIPRE